MRLNEELITLPVLVLDFKLMCPLHLLIQNPHVGLSKTRYLYQRNNLSTFLLKHSCHKSSTSRQCFCKGIKRLNVGRILLTLHTVRLLEMIEATYVLKV
jgi:hypothetical protein